MASGILTEKGCLSNGGQEGQGIREGGRECWRNESRRGREKQRQRHKHSDNDTERDYLQGTL